MDSTGHVADAGKPSRPQVFGHTQAAAAVVTMNQQQLVGGQRLHVGGNLLHRDESRLRDAADRGLVGLADVDQADRWPMLTEESGGFLNRDFQRGCGISMQ